MAKSKLEMCMETFPKTDIWMDSFSVSDHEYALAHGCVGITTSPTWVGHMLCDEYEAQKPLLRHRDAGIRQRKPDAMVSDFSGSS